MEPDLNLSRQASENPAPKILICRRTARAASQLRHVNEQVGSKGLGGDCHVLCGALGKAALRKPTADKRNRGKLLSCKAKQVEHSGFIEIDGANYHGNVGVGLKEPDSLNYGVYRDEPYMLIHCSMHSNKSGQRNGCEYRLFLAHGRGLAPLSAPLCA